MPSIKTLSIILFLASFSSLIFSLCSGSDSLQLSKFSLSLPFEFNLRFISFPLFAKIFSSTMEIPGFLFLPKLFKSMPDIEPLLLLLNFLIISLLLEGSFLSSSSSSSSSKYGESLSKTPFTTSAVTSPFICI